MKNHYQQFIGTLRTTIDYQTLIKQQSDGKQIIQQPSDRNPLRETSRTKNNVKTKKRIYRGD